jgi:hypothetical protein
VPPHGVHVLAPYRRYAAIADVARTMEEERVEAKLRTKRRATIVDAFNAVTARSTTATRGVSAAVGVLKGRVMARLGQGRGTVSGHWARAVAPLGQCARRFHTDPERETSTRSPSPFSPDLARDV